MRTLLRALISFDYSPSEKKKLLNSWWSFNDDYTSPEEYCNSLLHAAAKTGDITLFRKILNLENDIDINKQDENGWTALHIATYCNKVELVKILIEEYHATIDLTTFDGFTPMNLAADRFCLEVTKYLLEAGYKFPEYIMLGGCYYNGKIIDTEKFLKALLVHYKELYEVNGDDFHYKQIFQELEPIAKSNIKAYNDHYPFNRKFDESKFKTIDFSVTNSFTFEEEIKVTSIGNVAWSEVTLEE
jgi:ankyrin repeat protein